MDEVEAWLEGLTADTLLVERVGDHVTQASYQPCRATLQQVHGRIENPLWSYRRTLAHFDGGEALISIYPTKTRASHGFLEPKYRHIGAIEIEVEGLVEPDTEDAAAALLEELPEGFIKDWRWGLGIQKLYVPMIDMVRLLNRPADAFGTGETLRIALHSATQIVSRGYVLNRQRFESLRLAMARIQNAHQSAALIERVVLAHNSMLSEQDETAYPHRAVPYKPDTIYKIVGEGRAGPRLSRADRGALVKSVEARAGELAKDEPAALARLQKTVQIASLDGLIERFDALLKRPASAERDWQALLRENPFLLSLVFGFPIVLVTEQANVGGMTVDGDNARYADFLLKNEVTNSAALVEIKQPGTPLLAKGSYAGVRHVAGDLMSAVMQVLDQRSRLSTHELSLQGKTADKRFETWFVSCVVIAGRNPATEDEAKALDLYRNSLKDVSILTFEELLARLISLRSFLEGEKPQAPAPAAKPSDQ